MLLPDHQPAETHVQKDRNQLEISLVFADLPDVGSQRREILDFPQPLGKAFHLRLVAVRLSVYDKRNDLVSSPKRGKI